jgi:LPXTG-motif cell wall-anchored protein
MDTGTLTNSATATGTPRAGKPPVSSPSEAVVALPATPGITLTKTATPTVITSVGQDIAYSFLVTNTGNVTLTAITVDETAFSGSGTTPTVSCPDGPLAPAATVTCTAGYTSTTADVEAGEIANTAVAVGTPPSGAVVASDPSSASVSVFRLTLPLTGGTSAELVMVLGGAAILLAVLLAVRNLRRVRRHEQPSSPSTTTSAPLR